MAASDIRATVTDKGSILIVEDEPDFRRIYRHFLTREGYRIHEAEDGEKAWKVLQTNKPDLILLDLVLPKISGFDVLRQIRADLGTKDIPVVILSGLGKADDIKRSAELGATYHSVKGVESIRDVLQKISLSLAPRSRGGENTPEYRVRLRDDAGAAAQLRQTLGLEREFRCAECKTETLLELKPDSGRADGHWFSARLFCPNCQKTI